MAAKYNTPVSNNVGVTVFPYDIFTNVASALRKRGFVLILTHRDRSSGLCQARVLPLPNSPKHERIARAITADIENEWIGLSLECASREEWVVWLSKQERRRRDGQAG